MICSLGESLIDFTPVEHNGELSGFDLHPGGSPFNVAVAAARLGRPAAFAGRISTDLFGSLLVATLDEAGIDTRFVSRGPEPTMLAFVAYEGDEAQYSFRGENAAYALLEPGDLDHRELAALEALHLGSIALMREPIASTALELARALHARVVISLDPNVRPVFVEDWTAYRERLGELARLAGIVKASETDFELWGEDPAALARSGPAGVVVTRGGSGSTVHACGTVFDVPALRCRLVDTIGAGDAFTAGLLVALAAREALAPAALSGLDATDWRDAVGYAAAAAALTCERRGARPPAAGEVVAALRC